MVCVVSVCGKPFRSGFFLWWLWFSCGWDLYRRVPTSRSLIVARALVSVMWISVLLRTGGWDFCCALLCWRREVRGAKSLFSRGFSKGRRPTLYPLMSIFVVGCIFVVPREESRVVPRILGVYVSGGMWWLCVVDGSLSRWGMNDGFLGGILSPGPSFSLVCVVGNPCIYIGWGKSVYVGRLISHPSWSFVYSRSILFVCAHLIAQKHLSLKSFCETTRMYFSLC